MRTCMLAYSFYESDSRIRQYASALVERGDTVDIIALRRPEDPVHVVLEGVNVYRIQVRKYTEHGQLSYFYRIMRFLVVSGFFLAWKHLRHRYHLIHVHSVPDLLVFAALVPRLMGAPVILDIHDLLPELYAGKFRVRENSLLFLLLVVVERCSTAFASHVIVANDLWCQRVASRSSKPEKCSTIRNYPDPKLFFPRSHAQVNGKFILTYPGTLSWHQGLDVAINAFARVKDAMPDAEFHIYGDGPARTSLVDLAAVLNLRNRVVFHETLPTAKIAQVMATTDLAVEPKRSKSAFANEALSMKILEFMAVGVPLVVSRTKIHQYYYDDSLVKYYDGDDEAQLADNILNLRRDLALRTLLISNGCKYFAKNNWQAKKQEYLHLVDSLT
jgi:glycosyltransferase involved in cell wall biosynthesis